jgi:integrase
MRGNITKRGKAWRIKFDLDRGGSGERKTRYATVKGTREDAEKELTRLLSEKDKGTLVDPSKITVAEHLEQWLAGKERISPLTRERYGEIITKHIVPTLGAIKVQKLKPTDVRNWLVAMREGRRGQRSPRTIIHSYRVLHTGLESAVKLDIAARNVADNVEAPKPEDGERMILKANDVQAVLAALKEVRIFPVVALALSTGARRSELLALRWCDVDLQRGAIKIERNLEQTKGGLRFKSPKTKSGHRSIILPAFAVGVLNEHRKEQLELRLRLGRGKPEADAMVFANIDGSPISPNYFSIMWSRAVKRAGLPKVTFHSLRHSHASALIRAGLDVVRVSKQLGHSKPAITLSIYAHEFGDADSGAADAIEKVLG